MSEARTVGPGWAPSPGPVLAGTAAAGLALASAAAVGEASKMAVVLPLAAGVGLLMAFMAASRFLAFLLLTLGVRSSLDLAKLSGSEGAPRALDPAVLVGVLFLLAGMLWLAAQYRSSGGLPGSPLRTAMGVFLFSCSLSVVGSGNPGSSLLEAVRIASVVMMFVVVEQVCADPRRMRQVLLAVFASAVVPLAVTGVGFLTGHGRVEEKGDFTRVTGTFNQSNEFGRYLMLVIIMGVALYPALPARARRPMALLLAASGASLIPTYTRSALLATVVGLVVVGLIHNRRIVYVLVAAGAVALLAVPSLSARFADLGGSESVDTSVPESSLTWRLNYWQQVLPLAGQNPITGIGLAQTQRLTENQQPPHNDYVRAYVETGVLGFCAYVLLLWMLVSTGRHALAAAPRASLDRAVAAGFTGCAVAFVAVSAVANVFSNVVTLWYFAAFAAATAAVLRRRTTVAVTPLEGSWR